MYKEEIEKLRDKLHSLIKENADYSEILRVSQELDAYIVQYTLKSKT